MKKNRGMLILTTVVTLLPMLAGLILWNRLPEQIPTHWNARGVIDGWSDKTFAVFGICGIMAGLHLLCVLLTFADPKNKGHNEKSLWIVLWICPVMSVLVAGVMYGTALGMEFSVEQLVPVVLGVLFVVFGNLMPKFKQNSTMGIKTPWTLADQENWNATHRLGGRLWVIGGVVIMITGILGNSGVMVGALLVLAIVPVAYSYLFYRNKAKTEN